MKIHIIINLNKIKIINSMLNNFNKINNLAMVYFRIKNKLKNKLMI